MKRAVILCALLLGAPVLAQQAKPGEVARPFELHFFYNPGCSKCITVLQALKHDMRAEFPEMQVFMYKNTESDYLEKFDKTRGLGKIQGERWGAANVVYVGDGWTTDKGRGMVERLHDILLSKSQNAATPYSDEEREGVSGAQRAYRSLGAFGKITEALMVQWAARDAFGAPALLTLLGLPLLLWRRSGRAALALGLAFAAGIFLTRLLVGPELIRLPLPGKQAAIARMVLLLVGALGALFFAGLQAMHLTELRRRDSAPAPTDAPPAAPEGEVPPEAVAAPAPASLSSAPPRPLTGYVLLGLLAGFALTWISLCANGAAYTPVLGSVWRLGQFHPRVLSLAALHALILTLPVLIGAVLVGVPLARGSAAAWPVSRRVTVLALGVLVYLALGFCLLAGSSCALVKC